MNNSNFALIPHIGQPESKVEAEPDYTALHSRINCKSRLAYRQVMADQRGYAAQMAENAAKNAKRAAVKAQEKTAYKRHMVIDLAIIGLCGLACIVGFATVQAAATGVCMAGLLALAESFEYVKGGEKWH